MKYVPLLAGQLPDATPCARMCVQFLFRRVAWRVSTNWGAVLECLCNVYGFGFCGVESLHDQLGCYLHVPLSCLCFVPSCSSSMPKCISSQLGTHPDISDTCIASYTACIAACTASTSQVEAVGSRKGGGREGHGFRNKARRSYQM
jgi:hypothetical protein